MNFKRILLKLSGEVLGGEKAFGIENEPLTLLCNEIKSLVENRIETAVVIGGGNIFRGAQLIESGFVDRAKGDYMGMLSTVINGIALQTALQRMGIDAKLITSFKIEKIGELYNQDAVLDYLKRGKVLIFSGGTSNPYFTTDSTAALRAIEIGADILLKATKVDGVYSDDPHKNPKAERFSKISFDEVIDRKLKVMDLTAFTLCRENKMPILVYDSRVQGNTLNVLQNPGAGTLVS